MSQNELDSFGKSIYEDRRSVSTVHIRNTICWFIHSLLFERSHKKAIVYLTAVAIAVDNAVKANYRVKIFSFLQYVR